MLPRDAAPAAIRRLDYRPPAFLVDAVDLSFDLQPEATRVTATLAFRRNPSAHAGDRAAALVLDGEQQHDVTVALDGVPLDPSRYQLGERSLTIDDPPGSGTLTVAATINPAANVALEGLYLSSGTFCTQCEAEGFRRITYFPDRPDVLATYTVTLIADRDRFPVLLANGNRVDAGPVPGAGGTVRHFAKWHDPFPKPSYLFALVAGDLSALTDTFTTALGAPGRAGDLVDAGEPPALPPRDGVAAARDALGRGALRPRVRPRPVHDLCADDFNMGAMENKGLNIFNSKLVLAQPQTATDDDYLAIESVVGHEYFHNWTGNRVTCRDWFQLSLKEGLTVFRDQEFSSDLQSRAVERIAAVAFLRNHQFPEDAGPMAHPVRPDEYVEINNFYTTTVYEKGAEVIRMLHTLLGAERFRRGMDLYFERHDGQAVTCDDFVQAMADASAETGGPDLAQFRRWYAQAGTPVVTARGRHDPALRTYTLEVEQHTAPTPGQPEKAPFHIPLAVGLVGPDGRDLPLTQDGERTPGRDDARAGPHPRRPDLPLRRRSGAARAFAAARLLGAGAAGLRPHAGRPRVPRHARQRSGQPLGRRAAQLRRRDPAARRADRRRRRAAAAPGAGGAGAGAARRRGERSCADRAGADPAGPRLPRRPRRDHRRRRAVRGARIRDPRSWPGSRATRSSASTPGAASAPPTRRRRRRPARAGSPTSASATSARSTTSRPARSPSRTTTPPTT